MTTVWGPNRDPARSRRDQDAWDEHAAFMDSLVEDGFIIIGGPIDEERTMLAIEARDVDEIRSRMAEDPWAPIGLLQIEEIRPWTIWLDGRTSQRGRSPAEATPS